MASAGTNSPMDELRREPRAVVQRPGWIALGKGMKLLECTVWDESENGARLGIAGAGQLPDEFYLYFSLDFMSRRHCRVVWRSDKQAGVKFLREPPYPTDPGAASA